MININIGDTVWVYFSSTEHNIINGIVEHMPGDTGDMWYIREGSTIKAVNPNSSELITIEKYEKSIED
jgi:predicted RNA-binding protein with PUA-like domain